MTSSNRVASAAKDMSKEVVDSLHAAATSAGGMATQAASNVGELATQAASQAGKKIDSLSASAGAAIQDLGNQLSKNAPQAGMLGDASRAVAQRVKEGGEYLENAKLSGVSDDFVQLIRRNPVLTVVIGMGVGWFIANRLKQKS